MTRWVGGWGIYKSIRIKFSTDKQTHRPIATTGASNWAHLASGGMLRWGHPSLELDHYLYSPLKRTRMHTGAGTCTGSFLHLSSRIITFATWTVIRPGLQHLNTNVITTNLHTVKTSFATSIDRFLKNWYPQTFTGLFGSCPNSRFDSFCVGVMSTVGCNVIGEQ